MTILCYHAVEPAWTAALSVPPSTFRRHAAWLARGRAVVPLDRALELMDSSYRLPRTTAAITFDDGFRSVYDHAFPVLAEFGLPATVFIVTGTLTGEQNEVNWLDVPQPPGGLDTMGRDEILEMHTAGIRFGSHSHLHLRLPELSDHECEQDLRQSREILEDLLGEPVPYLAYPRGLHDERVRRAAQRAGYTHALGLPERRETFGRYAVPRVGVHHGNGVGTLRLKTSRPYLALRTAPLLSPLRSVVRRLRS
ncbi:MAG: polysaccharide deacetylase family protein [Actinobacteria bacterium]|nr:polysaccharide deacetylase family protein [Actinomycetota bacterium]